jgi:Dyp-type peroxidase family
MTTLDELPEETASLDLVVAADPSHPEGEPLLAMDQIQGNILDGFNKDNQTLIFLRIRDGEVEDFRRWLAGQIPFIATASEVHAFNDLFKAVKKRRGRESGAVEATWLNIAFSHQAFVKLQSSLPDLLATDFTDASFRAGLAARSEALNDSKDPNAEGNKQNWVIGGPDNEADLVLIVESDDRDDMLEEVARLEASIEPSEYSEEPPSGLEILLVEEGATLPDPLRGHEHFGFRDGISQPGVRGRISSDPADVLQPRTNPDDRGQGKPGQDVLWPGEFVFGYPGQKGPVPDPVTGKVTGDIAEPSEENKSAGPAWADNGSYLVFRRLRQDVRAFHEFLHSTGNQLAVAPAQVGAKLVGRWPSGAPTVRTSDVDNVALADDECANNKFEFNGNAETTPPKPAETPVDCVDDFPEFPPPGTPAHDPTGARCPISAHTRKAYPRNDRTPGGNGGADPDEDLSEVSTQQHRLLRRGIPYGPVSQSTLETPIDDGVDRGLHFLAYQTSITGQFEFVTRAWVNNPNFSTQQGTGNEVDGVLPIGHDPVIGQAADGGERHFSVTFVDADGEETRRLTTDTNWVIPTGGGYFFAPSIEALTMLGTE